MPIDETASPEGETAHVYPGQDGAEPTKTGTESQAGRPSARRSEGSYSYDDPERPRWDRDTVLEREYRYHHADGSYAYSKLKGRRADGEKAFLSARRFQGSMGELQMEKQDCGDEFYRLPGLEFFRKGTGDEPDLLYRLPELQAEMAARPDDPVFITEGEKDADTLCELGLIATTNPNGALNWRADFSARFAGHDVAVLIDNDDKGRTRGAKLLGELRTIARSVKVMELPGLAESGDVTDWLAAGRSRDDLLEELEHAGEPELGERPEILLRAGSLADTATMVEQALKAGGAPFFVRGELVRPVVDTLPAAHGRATKSPRLVRVDPDTVTDHISRHVDLQRWDARRNRYVPTDPPRLLAQTILAREGEWSFPKLTGVTTCPTFCPNGTIHSEPGYDPATGMLLLEPPAMPPIAERPTRADAEAGLRLLEGLLPGFPFADDASRSVALSALLTPVVRGIAPVVPLHAISAPVAGSGKSYLIDLASAIATGERAPVIAAGHNEEETEKRLGAALLSGQPIVSIDNVNGQLGGDALCQLIERPRVSVRPLGSSRLVTIESRATTYATGNNIQLTADMTRRGILCSLDPNMERPELRTFDLNPFETITADRGKFIAAALTIVRAYIVAGCPGALPPLASFEAWSTYVRSALVWLGCADPLATMEAARAEDPVTTSLRMVMHSWHQAVGDEAKKAGEMKALAEEHFGPGKSDLEQALIEVAADRFGAIDPVRLGRFLLRHKGRIVDGLRLLGHDDGHSKQKVWSVRHV